MNVRARFWVECGLAVLSGAMTVVTAISAEWIELVFGIDPDGGSGALEWGLVVALAGVTLAFSLLARRESARTITP